MATLAWPALLPVPFPDAEAAMKPPELPDAALTSEPEPDPDPDPEPELELEPDPSVPVEPSVLPEPVLPLLELEPPTKLLEPSLPEPADADPVATGTTGFPLRSVVTPAPAPAPLTPADGIARLAFVA